MDPCNPGLIPAEPGSEVESLIYTNHRCPRNNGWGEERVVPWKTPSPRPRDLGSGLNSGIRHPWISETQSGRGQQADLGTRQEASGEVGGIRQGWGLGGAGGAGATSQRTTPPGHGSLRWGHSSSPRSFPQPPARSPLLGPGGTCLRSLSTEKEVPQQTIFPSFPVLKWGRGKGEAEERGT